MLQREMNFYRKWMGICQLSTVRPITLTHLKDDVIIKGGEYGKALLKITKDEFESMSVHEILTAAGIPENDNI